MFTRRSKLGSLEDEVPQKLKHFNMCAAQFCPYMAAIMLVKINVAYASSEHTQVDCSIKTHDWNPTP